MRLSRGNYAEEARKDTRSTKALISSYLARRKKQRQKQPKTRPIKAETERSTGPGANKQTAERSARGANLPQAADYR
jgi:hypothetical protein